MNPLGGGVRNVGNFGREHDDLLAHVTVPTALWDAAQAVIRANATTPHDLAQLLDQVAPHPEHIT